MLTALLHCSAKQYHRLYHPDARAVTVPVMGAVDCNAKKYWCTVVAWNIGN